MCFSSSYRKSTLRVHIYVCSEFKKPTVFCLTFHFPCLASFGSVWDTSPYLSTLSACWGSRYVVKGFPLSSAVILPHENSYGAGY